MVQLKLNAIQTGRGVYHLRSCASFSIRELSDTPVVKLSREQTLQGLSEKKLGKVAV